MPTLNEVSAEEAPVHLLLIADSKVGKSTYAAEAAIDGFELIYIDADNGLSALRNRIKQEADADDIMKRVHYFAPASPLKFTRLFMKSTSKKPLLWLPEEDKALSGVLANQKQLAKEAPDTPLWVMDFTKIPKTSIVSIDSWTALAADALGLLRSDQMSALLDGSADQSLYGEARIGLVYLSNIIQQAQCHFIVQAHSTRYEIYSKPKGASGNTKQREMTLEETITVPVSSSRAHGLEMASRFNHIGNLGINSLGAVEIDFTRSPNRVGGGPPNRKAKVKDLRFTHLTDVKALDNQEPLWYSETTVGKFIAAVESKGK